MKWIALVSLVFLVSCQPAVEYAEADWGSDLAAALESAAAGKQRVLLDFTGSDWCPPCQALHRNVLATKPFADYAKDNLVLVLVDFPRSKPLPEDRKQANEALALRFKVEGFPVLVLLNPAGVELARMDGYGGESAAQVVAWLEKHRAP